MAINIVCPNCSRTMSARDEWAGRRAKCPTCGNVLVVPAADPPTDIAPPIIDTRENATPWRRKAKRKEPSNFVKALAIVALIFISIGIFGWMTISQIPTTMHGIHQQVADDAVRQYEIAKRNGTAIDAYVAAEMVAAAYLQAKDEPNYQKWKRIVAAEADRAGMPSY